MLFKKITNEGLQKVEFIFYDREGVIEKINKMGSLKHSIETKVIVKRPFLTDSVMDCKCFCFEINDAAIKTYINQNYEVFVLKRIY